MASYYETASEWLGGRRAAIYRWAHVLIPAFLLLLVAWMRVREWTWVVWVQHKAFDTFQAMRPRPYEPVPVRVVDIDDESLAKLGQWPWPRTVVARLVTRLSDLGASAIVFDVVFSEPDRTSPARIVALWPDSPALKGVKEKVRELPDHDRLLAKAIASANVVAGFAPTAERSGAAPAVKVPYGVSGEYLGTYLRGYAGAVINLPVIEKAAKGNGSFGFAPEIDQVIRRAPLIYKLGRALLPSLAVEGIRVALGSRDLKVKSSQGSGEWSFGQRTGIAMVRIGSGREALTVPTDSEGQIWVYYTASAPERTIPVWRVFDKDFEAEKVAGTICFIGTSAAGLKDLRTTPLNPAAPGVDVHANVAEQILLGRYLRRPDWATGAEVISMLLFGFGLMLLLPLVGAARCALVALAAAAAALASSWHAFTAWGYLLDPVFPCLSVLMIYLSSSLISYLKTEAERRQVKGAFSRYMSPILVEELAKHPEKLRLGGESRKMTFHFCDIQGFTSISEFYDPQGLTKFLNRFLTPMTEIILRHRGMIDKYIGDCIMACWNAPLDDPDHERNACIAVLEMHQALKRLNEERRLESEAEGKKFIPIRIRTGLNTGECIVGNMGSDQRFDYSVLGDDVNLASRLEGANKFFHTYIMASEATIKGAGDGIVARELGRVRVVGKAVPIKVYNLIAKKGEVPEAWAKALPVYNEGLELFYKKEFEKAEARFGEVLKIFPEDGPSALYENAVKGYVVLPPLDDWDGVFNLKEK